MSRQLVNLLNFQYAFKGIIKGKTQAVIREELSNKGFKVSRNNLSILLKNPVYMGKIVVPKEGEEQEQWIEGILQMNMLLVC